mgnify:CR=1 FL=1
MQPLSGLLVLDFTTLLPGPLATLMLAEAGAEVIKIERPGGETCARFRADGSMARARSFAMLNRGKTSHRARSQEREADRCQARSALIKRADILVEQFRPGVMARLGLGYDDVRAINPRLVYCSITGYGQSGPRADEAGHDLNYIGNTGLLDLQPGPGRTVRWCRRCSTADIAGGTFAGGDQRFCWRCGSAIKAGRAAIIDIAMTDAMFTFAWAALALGAATGRFPAAGETCGSSAARRVTSIYTDEGRNKLVACGAIEQKFWDAFTKAIGLAGAIHGRHARPEGDMRCCCKIDCGQIVRGMAAGSSPRPTAARPS